MPIQPPLSLDELLDIRRFSNWCQSTRVTPTNDSVNTNQLAGASQAADNSFHVKRNGAMAFDTLQDSDIPSGITRDAEMSAADALVAANAAAALSAHVAAGDPHPTYLTQSEGDARYRELTDPVTYAELTGKPAVLALLFSGTGSPESVVTAGVGSLYLRTDGGAGTTLYVKESGAGNTGWVGK